MLYWQGAVVPAPSGAVAAWHCARVSDMRHDENGQDGQDMTGIGMIAGGRGFPDGKRAGNRGAKRAL